LNALGYASGDGRRHLDLVYNPLGASLPPPQATLEAEYRDELWKLFGIRFDGLLTITNMPIKRFARALERQGELDTYLALLVQNFNPETVPRLMCKSTLSVEWDGSLYDCDFNQARGLPLDGPKTLFDLEQLNEIEDLRVATDDHCFACTAGSGSSCGGALA